MEGNAASLGRCRPSKIKLPGRSVSCLSEFCRHRGRSRSMLFEPLFLQPPGASPSWTRRRFWQGGSSTSQIGSARASVVQAREQALAASTCGQEFVRKCFTARVGKGRAGQLTTLAFRKTFDETLARPGRQMGKVQRAYRNPIPHIWIRYVRVRPRGGAERYKRNYTYKKDNFTRAQHAMTVITHRL